MSHQLNRHTLFTIFDPATESTFGVLFVLFNPYTKKIKVVDEIYETNVADMTVRAIWSRVFPITKKYRDLGVRDFRYVYDEAAAWFRNESHEVAPDCWLEATSKNKTDKVSGLSLFRDILREGLVQVAAHCVHFIKECENYIKDDKGRIPKKDDHLIDCFRYFLDAAGFEFRKEAPPKEKDPDLAGRYRTNPFEDQIDDENLSEIE